MGKSKTIEHWRASKACTARKNYRITADDKTDPRQSFFVDILGEKEVPRQIKHFISDYFTEKTLIWFENSESLLRLRRDNVESHKPYADFGELIEALGENANIKIILESRYRIDFGVLSSKVVLLSGNELGALPLSFFTEDDVFKSKFTEEETKIIFDKLKGNTWLMLSIAGDFDPEESSKEELLKSLKEIRNLDEYRMSYLGKLFELVEKNEHDTELLCSAAFRYEPFSKEDFPGKAPQSFTNLRKKLLLSVAAQKYWINGLVREVCRLYFKDKAVFQKVTRDQKHRVGKAFRTEKPNDRIEKYEFLNKHEPFIPYDIELAKAYGESKQFLQAEKTLKKALNKTTNTRSLTFIYTNLIHVVETYEQALDWFEEMQAKDIFPDAHTYSSLISKSKTYEQAQAWLDKMQAKGIVPNKVTYSSLIKKAGNYGTALKHYREFLQKFPYDRRNRKRIESYNYLFTGMCRYISRSAHWQSLKADFERMGVKFGRISLQTYDRMESRYDK